MKITLEVSLSDRSFGETVRGQLIQAGVNGMNSGALTRFEIAESASQDAATIRWVIDHVVRAMPHADLEELAEALEKVASAVETLQVKVS